MKKDHQKKRGRVLAEPMTNYSLSWQHAGRAIKSCPAKMSANILSYFLSIILELLVLVSDFRKVETHPVCFLFSPLRFGLVPTCSELCRTRAVEGEGSIVHC
jgi:hypothetical protein